MYKQGKIIIHGSFNNTLFSREKHSRLLLKLTTIFSSLYTELSLVTPRQPFFLIQLMQYQIINHNIC